MGFCWNPKCESKKPKETFEVDAKYTCSICKIPRYCGVKCQKKDWEHHKLFCDSNHEERVVKVIALFWGKIHLSDRILKKNGSYATLFTWDPNSNRRCIVCTGPTYCDEFYYISTTQTADLCSSCKDYVKCKYCGFPHRNCPLKRRFYTFIFCQPQKLPKDVLKMIFDQFSKHPIVYIF